MPTVRILAEDMSQPSFQGQQVRAVGKLVNVLEGSVELQLAGAEGRALRTRVPRRTHVLLLLVHHSSPSPRRPHPVQIRQRLWCARIALTSTLVKRWARAATRSSVRSAMAKFPRCRPSTWARPSVRNTRATLALVLLSLHLTSSPVLCVGADMDMYAQMVTLTHSFPDIF